ncbi:MAG: hypothetical protein IPO40_24605 [Fibrobacteres bacterium]|nr:hypothetical protein [Fibrobacterota bacterium]
MDTIKTIAIALATALVAIVGFNVATQSEDLGYAVTPGISMFPASFTSVTTGGGIYATSSNGSAATLQASDIATNNIVEMTWNLAAGTLTLPASSTLSNFAPNPGDERAIYVRNASPTAATSTTIATATGLTLKMAASSTPLLVGDTDADNTARLIFVRKADSDFNVYLTKFQD